MTSSNTPAGAPRDEDRETLSALFDGELDPHGRLFATRRLSHDTAWQADCGRWQLVGDAMRRQAPIAAPATFAAQVMQGVARERAADAAKAQAARAVEPRRVQGSAVKPRASRSRWVGAAVAASVALAAVLIARPFDSAGPVTSSQSTLAAGATPVAPAVAVVSPDSAALPAVSASTVAEVPVGATPVQVVASNGPPQSAGTPIPPLQAPLRSRRALASAAAATARMPTRYTAQSTPPASNAAVGAIAPLILASRANPFALPAASPIAARPWPRAVLGRQGDATFAAGYRRDDDLRGAAPSFFPFGPAPQPEAPADAQTP